MTNPSQPKRADLSSSKGVHTDDDRIADYLAPHANSPRTLSAYTDVLRRLQSWCKHAGIESFLNLTEDDAHRFRADLALGKVPSVITTRGQDAEGPESKPLVPLSRPTVDHYVGIVQTFFDHLMREGHLTSNPFFRLSKISKEEAASRRQRKLATLDAVGAAALMETIALWPRHSPRYKACFHQARWIVCLATNCALTPEQMSSLPMSSFKLVSDRWCIEVASAGNATKRILIDDSVVDGLIEYRTWVRSFAGLGRVTRVPGQGEEPQLPLIGSTSDPQNPIRAHRVRKVLREVVAETISRLQHSGDSALVKSLESFKIRRTTAEDIAQEIAKEQRVDGDLIVMTQRFHWVQDCPPGPNYVARQLAET